MKPPLAEELRPKSLDEVIGQQHLLGENGFITNIIKSKKPLSLILWGPPGIGKTTISMLYAKSFNIFPITFNATLEGMADLKKIIQKSVEAPLLHRQTLLLVDEIHRFNRAQQDAFLPYLENGTFILIGATTENPSFSLNNPLLSRLRVLKLNFLEEGELNKILERYEKLKTPLPLTKKAKKFLIDLAQGDGRYLLNILESIENKFDEKKIFDISDLETILQRRPAHFDAKGDGRFTLISSLHKSIRGSDPDAAIYWLARILEAGEDPMYIARRLIRIALEDISLADPQAISLAISARDAYNMLGFPEGDLALAQIVIYLSMAPKSNAVYKAFKEARELAKNTSRYPPPPAIINAPTKMMKDLGYGKNYIYDHDTPEGFSGQNYFPKGMNRVDFYKPIERGFEREMRKRLDYFKKMRSPS